MITEAGSSYRKEREDCGTNVSRIYNQSVSMAEKVGTAAGMPRLTSRQQHRSNPEAQTPIEYFQRNVAILGCRDGAVVRALASHQCGPGSIPRLGVICGLSLLVLYPAPRGFLRVLRFPLSSKTII